MFQRTVFAVLALSSAVSSAVPVHVQPRAVTRSLRAAGLEWASVPEAAATLIDWLLGRRIADDDKISALITGERRVCIDRFGRAFCWEPSTASPAERNAVTEMACRALSLRHHEQMKEISARHGVPTASVPVPAAYFEDLTRARRRASGILRDAGVPFNELQQDLQRSLTAAAGESRWPPEAAEQFDNIRRALTSVGAKIYNDAFERVHRLLENRRRAKGRLPDSRDPITERQIGEWEPPRLGMLEKRLCASAAAEEGTACPLRQLESQLVERLREELGGYGLRVSVFVHGRTPIDPHTFDLERQRRGLPQPFRLDLERFDPEIEIELVEGPRLSFRLQKMEGTKPTWTFVPQAFSSRQPGEKATPVGSAKPFAHWTDRQIACAAGWGAAPALKPPPAAPAGLPPVAALRARAVPVYAVETARREDGSDALESRLSVFAPSNPTFATAEVLPVDTVSFGSFFFPTLPDSRTER